MGDLRHYSHEFITEFIELYKQYPCLWKIKSKEYSNKNKKADAYEVLCAKLKETDPSATKDSVIKKINSLRSCFRKEVKKVKASETSGTGTEYLYKPTLWYFDLLLFLLDQETPRPSSSNMEEISEDEEGAEDGLEGEDADESLLEQDRIKTPDTPASTSASVSSVATSSKSGVKRKGRNDKTSEILDLVASKLKSPTTEQFSTYGKHIAEELRTLPKDQALFCQKIINEAIFEAKMGNLNRGAKIITNEHGYHQQGTASFPVSRPVVNYQQADIGQYYSNFSQVYHNDNNNV